MASLISIAEYKVWAGITGTAQDALLTVLVDAVSMEVRRLCDRNLTNGFENNAWAHNVSPQLLRKYMEASEAIAARMFLCRATSATLRAFASVAPFRAR